jgi:type IV pilus assembly protein PilA
MFSKPAACSQQPPGSDATQTQPNTNKRIKNVKLQLAKSAKAGFSLVEMLVVIAIIGIIAAIAIPNIGNINQSARGAAAQRNAQQVASVHNAAVTVGATPATDVATAVAAVQGAGIAITDGPFAGRSFTVGTMAADDVTALTPYLAFQNGILSYSKQ